MKHLNQRLRKILSVTLLVSSLTTTTTFASEPVAGPVAEQQSQTVNINDPVQPLTCAGFYLGCGFWDNTGDSRQCPSYIDGLKISGTPPTMVVTKSAYDNASVDFEARVKEFQTKMAQKDSLGKTAGNAAKDVGGYTAAAALGALYNPVAGLALIIAAPVALFTAPMGHHRKNVWRSRAMVGEILWEADLRMYDGPGILAVTKEVQKQIPSVTSAQVADLLAQQDAVNGSLCRLKYKGRNQPAASKTLFSVKNVQQLTQVVASQLGAPKSH